jgi:NIPSNAP
MYIIRDIFQLKFGMFKEALAALKNASTLGLLPPNQATILSDFTGDSYRLVLESSFPTLAEYEQSLTQAMKEPKWQVFYQEFKSYVVSSHREIMKKHNIS